MLDALLMLEKNCQLGMILQSIFTHPHIHRAKKPSLLCLREAAGGHWDAPAASACTGCAAFTMMPRGYDPNAKSKQKGPCS